MAAWSAEKKEEYRKNHPVTMPELQPRHNYACGDVRAYFDAIFNADHAEYKGMVSIAARDVKNGDMRLIAVVPATQLGDWAAQMHVSTRMDYYYSKAQHRGNETWGADGAFAYNAIYVDLDAHNVSGSATAEKNVINLIVAMLPEEGYPLPNIVEHSGRGIHLIWMINQVPAKLGWMVRAVSKAFASKVQDLLRDYNVCGYQVDIGYTSNIAGLSRMPGTYNTTCRSYATYDLIHHNRMNLTEAYDTVSVHNVPNSGVCASIGAGQYTGQRRVAALLSLASIRPIQFGYRDKYLLHLFSAAQMAGMSNAAALDLAQSTNASFPTPMRECEVARYLSSAMRKRYLYRTATIIADLNITSMEQKATGLFAGANRDTNKTRKARNTSKKIHRNRKIMRLHMLGMSTTAIASTVRHAYNTVRKVIQSYEDCLSDIFSSAELRHIHQQHIKLIVARIHMKKTVFQKMTRYILCFYGHTQLLEPGTITGLERLSQSDIPPPKSQLRREHSSTVLHQETVLGGSKSHVRHIQFIFVWEAHCYHRPVVRPPPQCNLHA